MSFSGALKSISGTLRYVMRSRMKTFYKIYSKNWCNFFLQRNEPSGLQDAVTKRFPNLDVTGRLVVRRVRWYRRSSPSVFAHHVVLRGEGRGESWYSSLAPAESSEYPVLAFETLHKLKGRPSSSQPSCFLSIYAIPRRPYSDLRR